jgi:hypothetical protein
LSAHKFKQSLLSVRETAKREAEESLMLKVREKEEQIASMQRQVEELRRKAEQGSQQLQGEVQELELERLLCEQFPFDQIKAVPKGEFGGDVIQYVTNSAGQRCGAILWETKRTKNWNDGWLAKLREDQRAARADVALIVSQALPKGLGPRTASASHSTGPRSGRGWETGTCTSTIFAARRRPGSTSPACPCASSPR